MGLSIIGITKGRISQRTVVSEKRVCVQYHRLLRIRNDAATYDMGGGNIIGSQPINQQPIITDFLHVPMFPRRRGTVDQL